MAAVEPAAKRQRTETSPRSIITWNCNGFVSRSNWNASDMKKLLEETKYPDLVCLQEARLKAYDQHTRGRPLPSEYAVVKDTVESVFENYTPVWSLADNRYAGTLTFVHKRLGLDRTSQCAFSTDSAIDLMLKRFQRNREQVGLVSLSKPSSPAKKVVKQTSMKSFFAPKKMTSSGESSSPSVCTRNHHSEGRFQFFSFPDMDVIQTYVPNNGTKEESFCRRSQWDASMLQFVKDRRKLLEHCQQTERPLLWCGDFNVARDYRDGTHWEKREDGSIYEFWTNPEKCFVGKKGSVPTPENQENVGMPSFTAAERRRFSELLKEGDFSDVWRELHPTGVANSKLTSWDRPDYTWRGHLAQAGNYKSKFQGKAQRLDYFLLSPSKLVNNVDACQILGYGEQREGHYCGSDHCATVLSLCERLT